MRKVGKSNDWWDWGVILLLVAGGTIILWGSVWLAHSVARARWDVVTARTATSVSPEHGRTYKWFVRGVEHSRLTFS
jgi:hypothetical protein